MTKYDHTEYLNRCIIIAKRAGKAVQNNPQVGAILVHDNRIIGEGYHKAYGSAHAEVNVIANVDESDKQLISKSTLYVSLEPCNHQGKTGPCTDLIIRHQIPKVVIGSRDPNDNVESNGLEKLRSKGIEVVLLDLESTKQLIRPFTLGSLQKMPYVILKFAQSKDFYIGKEGTQIAISNKYSQHLVHKWRSEIDGIMVGTNTVLTDNPKLTNRLHPGDSPIRIILDKSDKIDSNYHVNSDKHTTWIYRNSKDLKALLGDLHKRGISRLMIEGGATLLKSFIKANLWHEARIITADTYLNEGIKAPTIRGKLIHKTPIGSDTLSVVYAA